MKLMKISLLVFFVCITLLIATTPVSADAGIPIPITEQQRDAIIEQINGAPITTEQYLAIVWPEIYKKMDSTDKTKLSTIYKVWNMTEGERTAESLLITSTHDGPIRAAERNVLIDVLDGLDITYGEFMQIVWPELYATMPDDMRQSMMTTPRPKSASAIKEKQLIPRSIIISANANLPVQNGRFMTYGASSTVSGNTPDYHYVEVYLKNEVDTTVDSTGYGKWLIDYESNPSQMMTVSAQNTIMDLSTNWYRTRAESQARIGVDTTYSTPVYSQWMKYTAV
ncbi:MAG: hypothetical protein O0W99_02320 [Methanocorpusculum sp.]|uniref:Uncharacterized protein n=2 Tax=Methanocorpusculum vombati TaxID=3002864 RepID=A0ABT4IKT0_9EURY|nr:hypothetical protein [Methanocorpusculum vombati]MDE2545624.1 hypothetical protein [Methanocorpusculum sp.]MDE2547620.1 hypothetical protein [Methanocorpusculum sp.]